VSPATRPGDEDRGESAASSWLGVSEGYERWAASYDRTPNPVIAREERYLEPFVQTPAGRSVLDLACGTGRWLEKVAAHRLSFGVDVSAAMLQVAKNKPTLLGKVVQADCLNLPFRSGTFDLVIWSFALAHIPQCAQAVGELARVIKPQGQAFVSDLHPLAYARGWRTGFRDARASVEIQSFPRSQAEIVTIFRAQGMDCEACESLCLGEAERAIFVAAKREHKFTAAAHLPAVLVCRFRKPSSKQPDPPERPVA
jgi:SAM-dependent methyltransferase